MTTQPPRMTKERKAQIRGRLLDLSFLAIDNKDREAVAIITECLDALDAAESDVAWLREALKAIIDEGDYPLTASKGHFVEVLAWFNNSHKRLK
jgi:hypothetical protein